MQEGYVYAHKLNAQELGYRSGHSGKAGRYIYISKKYSDFFPALSDNIKNDRIILDVIAPNSKEIVLTNYVYHNDKIAEKKIGGRDEFRFYLNENTDPNHNFFIPGDIVIIIKRFIGDTLCYKLFKYSLDKPAEYLKIDNLINKYGSQNHALIPESELSNLDFGDFSTTVFDQKKILPDEVRKTIFDIPIIEEKINLHTEELTKRVRNASFRGFVMLFYNYQCAITGTEYLIEYGSLSNLEAAHIIAFSAKGGDNPSNGIPLIKDLHWAFDNGFFTIDKNYKVKVHEKVSHYPFFKKINGNNLNLPEDSRAKPNLGAIEWHNKNIFGQFLKKQRLSANIDI